METIPGVGFVDDGATFDVVPGAGIVDASSTSGGGGGAVGTALFLLLPVPF